MSRRGTFDEFSKTAWQCCCGQFNSHTVDHCRCGNGRRIGRISTETATECGNACHDHINMAGSVEVAKKRRLCKSVWERLNKTEMRYFREMLDTHLLVIPQVTIPFSDGTSYRPDFMVVTVNGDVEFHEVKGGHVGKVAWSRHGIERFRRAREVYPQLTFRLFMHEGNMWKEMQ